MIDTQALRKKILDAVIHGKLTEQLPEDGNAEDLYKEIQAEKQRLIKEGKIKKEKPLPEIEKKKIPFDIPENWKWCRIGEILDLQAGKNITAKEICHDPSLDYPYPCFGGNGIRGYVRKYNRNDEHVIIGRQGALCGNVKKANGLFYATEHAVVVTGFAELCIGWQYYSIIALNLNQYATATAQPGLTVAKVNEVLIPLPPLAEQKRIATKLDSIFSQLDLIDEQQKKLSDNAQSLRNKLLELGISGELTEPLPEDGNAEDLYKEIQVEKQKLIKEGKIKKEKPLPEISDDDIKFAIPENWKWVRLPEIASTMLGKTLNRFTDNGELKPYLCSINVYWSGLNLETVKVARFDNKEQKLYRLQKNDVLICEGGDVGRTIIWNRDCEMYYQNALHRVRFYGEYVLPEYFKAIMECYKGKGLIDEYSTGMTIKHFVQSALNSIPLPLPPLAEQKRIVEKLDQLLPLCDAMRADISGGVGA